MNGYVCFWSDKRCEVKADTTFKAQQLSQVVFQGMAGRKKVIAGDISVTLAEKNGEQVVHLATD